LNKTPRALVFSFILLSTLTLASCGELSTKSKIILDIIFLAIVFVGIGFIFVVFGGIWKRFAPKMSSVEDAPAPEVVGPQIVKIGKVMLTIGLSVLLILILWQVIFYFSNKN
jgi:hypothetical protein